MKDIEVVMERLVALEKKVTKLELIIAGDNEDSFIVDGMSEYHREYLKEQDRLEKEGK